MRCPGLVERGAQSLRLVSQATEAGNVACLSFGCQSPSGDPPGGPCYPAVMANIHVEKPITSEPQDLVRRFEAEVLSLPNFKMFVDRYEIDGSKITFEGAKGISGTVDARPGVMIVDVALSGMAALMKPFIESKLNEVLSRIE